MSTKTESPQSQCVVAIVAVPCSFTLASAKWNHGRLVKALLHAAEPPGWISRDEAEALAGAIAAATGHDVPELRGRK